MNFAHATSRVRANPTIRAQKLAANTICKVSARFVEAQPKQGKVVWIFDRLSVGSSTCTLSDNRFEVWIWQGRYSDLNHSTVYPIYITEPSAGAEFDVELEHEDIVEKPLNQRYSGWFLADDDEPLKARTR